MRSIIFLCVCCLFAFPTLAQDTTPVQFELSLPDVALQTGQNYPVTITLDNVSDFWLLSFEIEYDPTKVYIIGTQSGSPLRASGLFPSDQSVTTQNFVASNTLIYTISMVAPFDSLMSGGSLAEFTIYPLSAGETSIRFTKTEIGRAIFAQQDGQRVGERIDELPSESNVLTLTITGDTVEPPSEATATPQPTETPTVFVPPVGNNELDPNSLPTAVPSETSTLVESTPASSNNLLLIGIVIVVIGAVGLGAVLFFGPKKKR
jgi:hypothetical protein